LDRGQKKGVKRRGIEAKQMLTNIVRYCNSFHLKNVTKSLAMILCAGSCLATFTDSSHAGEIYAVAPERTVMARIHTHKDVDRIRVYAGGQVLAVEQVGNGEFEVALGKGAQLAETSAMFHFTNANGPSVEGSDIRVELSQIASSEWPKERRLKTFGKKWACDPYAGDCVLERMEIDFIR